MEEVNCMEGKNLVKEGLLDGGGFVRVIKVSPETHPSGYTPEYLIAKAAQTYLMEVTISLLKPTNL